MKIIHKRSYIRIILDSLINILSNSHSVMMNLKDEPSQFLMYYCIVVGCKIRHIANGTLHTKLKKMLLFKLF